jgi:hypothetical protein
MCYTWVGILSVIMSHSFLRDAAVAVHAVAIHAVDTAATLAATANVVRVLLPMLIPTSFPPCARMN